MKNRRQVIEQSQLVVFILITYRRLTQSLVNALFSAFVQWPSGQTVFQGFNFGWSKTTAPLCLELSTRG
jgi:hypothetical protein